MNRLVVRLVISHVLVALLGAVATFLVVRQLAPTLFDRSMMGQQMGMGQTGMGQAGMGQPGMGQGASLRAQFAQAVGQALLVGAAPRGPGMERKDLRAERNDEGRLTAKARYALHIIGSMNARSGLGINVERLWRNWMLASPEWGRSDFEQCLRELINTDYLQPYWQTTKIIHPTKRALDLFRRR